MVTEINTSPSLAATSFIDCQPIHLSYIVAGMLLNNRVVEMEEAELSIVLTRQLWSKESLLK